MTARTGSDERTDAHSDATVSPAATLPALDERALDALRKVGREWSAAMPDAPSWRDALPVDPRVEYAGGDRTGRGRFVTVRSGRRDHPEDLEARPEAALAPTRLGRASYRVRRLIVGQPLRSTAVAEERMRKLVALPVLSSDALSSVAYGPEAMLAVLVVAGSSALGVSLPIAAAIVVLMIAVGLGYRQVIRAYPHGGGAYIVASDSLGSNWGLLAGAGLVLDYTLTVAVSVASGVEAVTSAIPALHPAALAIGLGVIAILVAGNLRGVRAAGALFAGPTYLFVVAIVLVVVAGLVKSAAHGFHATAPPAMHATEALGALLVLRAFASGATAMTGIEAISNSVPAFQPDEARNARRTLTMMIVLLIALFAGVVLLAHLDGAVPGGSQTLLSKLARASVGGGVVYGFVQAATALVLLLAANTAFNGFPRLLFFMARDSYMPRPFLRMGDRLAFTNGIVVLALLAAALFVAFHGKTNSLIPLYAVGVFLAFTLAQTGMVLHWLRGRDEGWRRGTAINLVGAALSAVVLVITAVTKFVEGAWVTVLLIPVVVLACRRVHRHYEEARAALEPHPDGGSVASPPRLGPRAGHGAGDGAPERQDSPDEVWNLALVPIAMLDLAGLRALAYAASLGQPVLAVHLSPNDDEAKRFHRYWEAWGDHLPLEVVLSPYRTTVAPLANYIEALHRQRPGLTLTVIVPQIVVRRAWQRLLHNRVAARLRRTLIDHPGIVITEVPFHL